MKIHLSSDEVNLLVYRYLVENGFVHTAYAFLNEGNISKNTYYVSHCDKLPSNALVSFLQKALIYIYIEYHTDHKDGKKISCEEPFSFFRRHECWNDENNSSENENKTELQLDNKISSNNLNSFGTSNNSNNRNNDNDDSNNSSNNYNNTKKNNKNNNNNNNNDNNNNNPKENPNPQKPKASRPHIYSSSFSNFASLNYNDSNLSFKDIKRNYVSIFAQAKTTKKKSNKRTNNNDESKEKNVKEESNSTSGNQKKKSKATKSSSKSNKVTESDNNKSEDGDGNLLYDKKKKKT